MTLTDRLNGTSLYLIGMMGAGKSTTGAALAKTLGYQFFDTDTVVEALVSQSVGDFFTAQGEAAFRQIETKALAELSTYRRLVIATGGGIVTQRHNWSYLHHGIVVWLDAPATVLQARLANDQGRPLLQRPDWKTHLSTLLAQRQALYAQADVRVTVGADETPGAIAARTLTLVDQRIRSEADSALLN